jgi:hypothetical protein
MSESGSFIMAFNVILIVANILTYRTFKDISVVGKTNIDLASMYVIVYVYTLIYISILIFLLKWVVYTSADFIGGTIDLSKFEKYISYLMKKPISIASYVLPLYVLCAIMSYSFDVNIMFGSDNMYSPYFQSFSCLLVMLFSVILEKKKLTTPEGTELIRFFLMSVTALSLLQNTVSTNSTKGGLDKFIAYVVNFLLNFNWNIIFILTPFILFGLGVLSVVFKVPVVNITMLCCGAAVVILLLTLLYINENIVTFFQKAQKFLFDNIILRSLLSWMLTVLVYSMPLLFVTYANGENPSEIFEIFKEIFNVQFRKILLAIIVILYSLQKFTSASDGKIKIVLNFMIMLSLILSSYKPDTSKLVSLPSVNTSP